MRVPALTLAILAAPAAAQVAVPPPPAPIALAQQPPVWDPAATYITVGQDEPGYRSWYLAAPWRAGQVKSFNDYLAGAEVAGIVPTWELFRTATSWKDCGGEPFEIPPTSEWPHIIQTLRYVRDYVVPSLGPVEPVSVYRNPNLNVCAGGAPESAHKHYSAIDMVPLTPITRDELERKLCAIHGAHGEQYGTGLGFYAFLRFHIDTTKYRRWGTDPAVAADCPPIIHPDDVASVYQPPLSPAVVAAPTAQPAAVVAAPATQPPPPAASPPQPPLPPKA
jgi:hypothetical protein